MVNTIISPTILSPVMLWENFDAQEALKESNTGEETYGNVVYRDMYFSGRDTGDGRVRIFGVYAKSKSTGKKSNKGAILILPDMCDTVNYEIINIYVNQGYSVLMIDYRGEWEGAENYTKYPSNISYANYKNSKDKVDSVPLTAKETCWYEWAAVAKYAVSFLKSRLEVETIGVLGIRNGANVGWILCGTDARVDCFVPLFGAGWRGYRGIYKNGKVDLHTDDEKLRFLAGVDAHAYAQYVKCPTFFMTSTNSPDFDFDRSVDTMMRVSGKAVNFTNYTPNLRDTLDRNCRRNIDLFFAKYLLNFKLLFPSEPVLTCTVVKDKLTFELELDFSELKRPKKISVFVAEGTPNAANRDWLPAVMEKSLREDKKTFTYNISGNCGFVTAYAVIEYRSGVTLSSKAVCKKVEELPQFTQKLLYSAKDKESSFSPFNTKENALGGIFFEKEDAITCQSGANGISGVSSPYGLITYKVNSRNIAFTSNSIVMFDVYAEEYTNLRVTIMVEVTPLETQEYSFSLELKGGPIWQKNSIRISDFKNTARVSLKELTNIVGLRFESESRVIFNNILII